MARYLVDTNMLVRRVESRSNLGPVVRHAFQVLRARGDEPVMAAQSLYEFWVVATRPISARGGLGYSPERAARLMVGLIHLCPVVPDSPLLWLE